MPRSDPTGPPGDQRPATPAALLLTGGASRRLGRDKASVVVGGISLAHRASRLLGQVASPVIEVGPGQTGLPCTRESPPGAGPLAAIAAGGSALVELGHPGAALVLAVDMPLVTVALLRLLAEHPGQGCVVPIDHGGQAQPLCARYSRAALDRAVDLAAAGEAAPKVLLGEMEVAWLPPSDWLASAGSARAFDDIDTDEDLARVAPRVIP